MASVTWTRGTGTVVAANAIGGTYTVTNPSAAPIYYTWTVAGVHTGWGKVQAGAVGTVVTYPAGAVVTVMAGADVTATVV